MSLVKPKIIVVCGPTASGKSAAAIKLAKKFNGEIISADSRQVYRGMDIGSGKVIKDESGITNQESSGNAYFSEGVRHYLIDVADPKEDFNISHFKDLAEKAIAEILAKGKLPIICGGTGFWIQAITDNMLLPKVEPDPALRSELGSKTAAELFEILEKLDCERAKDIDRQNKYRLIRAIEIATKLGSVPSKSSVIDSRSIKYDFLQIGIEVPREILNAKIKKRLEERFDEGMIQEVENLHNPPAGGGISWQRLEYFGLEYRWIARFLQEKISLEEMKEKLYFDIIHYAKRQMTWFRRNKKIVWLKDYEEIKDKVKSFL